MYRLILLLFLSPLALEGQIDRTRSWYFGDGLSIFFPKDKSGLKVKTNLSGYTGEGTGTFNDSAGHLLYYSDWGNLYDSANNKINTSDFTLGGDGSSCQATILTSLNDTILHCFGSSAELYDSKFKLGGFNYSAYDIISKKWITKALKLRKAAAECQSLVNHQNGKLQWVVSHSRLGDTLFSYLVSDKELETCPVISQAGPFYDDWYPGQGVMKFSPNGKYLVITTWDLEKFVLCSFNNQTGQVKELFQIICLGASDAEFHDNYLFIGGTKDGKIHQYSLKDTSKIAFQNSHKIVYDTSDIFTLGQIQSAADNKMYVALAGDSRLGQITRISEGNYKFSYTPKLFGSKTCDLGFPNFNASYFYTPPINYTYKQDCKNNSFSFTGMDTFSASNHSWEIAKSGKMIKFSGKTITHTFTDTGIWKIKYIALNGIKKDSITKAIEIFPIFKPHFLGNDIGYCDSGLPINLYAPTGMNCYTWQTPKGTISNVNTIKIDTAGKYYLQMCNPVFCNYYDTVTVYPRLQPAKPKLIRKGDSLYVSNTELDVKYMWFKNNSFTGKTGSGYKLTDTGVYSVIGVIPSKCYSDTSFFHADILKLNSIILPIIKVYPNPAQTKLNLEELPMSGNIEIFDCLGKCLSVITIEARKMIIPIESFPSANYEIRVVSERYSSIARFLKM